MVQPTEKRKLSKALLIVSAASLLLTMPYNFLFGFFILSLILFQPIQHGLFYIPFLHYYFLPTLLSIQFFTHLEYQSSEELCFPLFVVDDSRSRHKSYLLTTSKIDLNGWIDLFRTIWHVNLEVKKVCLFCYPYLLHVYSYEPHPWKLTISPWCNQTEKENWPRHFLLW